MSIPQTKKSALVKPPSFRGSDEMVTIIIATEAATIEVLPASVIKDTFVVHKSFLTYHSKFFNAAFNGRFKEAITQTISFDDVDPELFTLIVDWLYSGSLKIEPTRLKSESSILSDLSELWILADRFLMKGLQNDVSGLIIKRLQAKDFVGFEILAQRAYRINDGDNALAKIAVHAAATMRGEMLSVLADSLPDIMGMDIATAMRAKFEADIATFFSNPRYLPAEFGPHWDRFKRDLLQDHTHQHQHQHQQSDASS